VIVGKPKWVSSFASGMVTLLVWTLVSTTLKDFGFCNVTVKLLFTVPNTNRQHGLLTCRGHLMSTRVGDTKMLVSHLSIKIRQAGAC